MNSLSINQALALWSQLYRAYYNDNNFGGNVAEIYAYTLQPNRLCLYVDAERKSEMFNEQKEEIEQESVRELYELIHKFSIDNNCVVLVDNKEANETTLKKFADYRWHITVVRHEKKRE